MHTQLLIMVPVLVGDRPGAQGHGEVEGFVKRP